MLIFFQELILLIILWILRMIDGIMEIYNTLLNIEIIDNMNEETNILSFLLNDSQLLIIFISIFLITIFLSLIFVISSIIKNMFQNNKNISTIISKFFISIISTMIVFIIMFITISISNILLNLILNHLDINNTISISKLIFNNSVGNYLYDYTINEIDFSIITPNQILGDYVINSNSIFPNNWELNGMINPNNFYYLPSLISSSIVLISLIINILNIIKRIYKIVLLYITLPLSLSTLPLDDGLRFKIWKEELIKQILLIFITIFSLKIFYLVLPILLNMNVLNNISKYSKSLINLLVIVGGSIFITSSQFLLNKINSRKEIL